MINGNNKVTGFIQSSEDLMKQFGCDGDFFLKPLVDMEWAVRYEDDFPLLSYWSGDSGNKTKAVIVRKNGEPMIYKNGGYTMIVAIDCVKIAFIFHQSKEIAT